MFTRVAKFCRNIFNVKENQTKLTQNLTQQNSTAIPRDRHSISRQNINENALKVLYRLNKAGYEAYLVGGGVRDLLLGNTPKDFDIATSATPEQVRKLFRNCRLVGRRFRLAHIMFGQEIIEVATFRGAHSEESDKNASSQTQGGLLLRDNVYGSLQEDALRRDFTINSLYYNASDFTVHDFTNGLTDLQHGIIRLIGDPDTRYREDPVRMLRAVRFAAKLAMTIEPATAKPITQLAHLLSSVSAARLFEESLKMLQVGHGYQTYLLMCQYQLFQPLFPAIAQRLTPHHDSNMERIILQVLKNTDARIQQSKRVNPAFLFATMLWYPLIEHAQRLAQEGGLAYYEAFALAINDILDEQCKTISIPKRITTVIRDIWQLQFRLVRREGKKAYRLLEQPKFRAAFDLLELRADIEKGELVSLYHWWQEFQDANDEQKKNMVNLLNKANPQRRHHRNSRKSTTPPRKQISQ